MIRAVAGVVIGEDGPERVFFALGIDLVVLLLLGQVFLDLTDIRIPLGGWGEDARDIQRRERGIGGLSLGLHALEQRVVFDGIVDGRGGEDGIEAASAGGGIVLGEDGFDDGFLGDGFAGLGWVFAVGLEVVDVEAQDVSVLDGVGDGVGVELLLEQVRRSAHGGLGILDLLQGCIGIKDGCARKAEELGAGEERFNGLVVFAELGAVALVENEDYAFVGEGFELLFVGRLTAFGALLVAFAIFVQGES